LPKQLLTEASRHRDAVVPADQRAVMRCLGDDLSGLVHDVSHSRIALSGSNSAMQRSTRGFHVCSYARNGAQSVKPCAGRLRIQSTSCAHVWFAIDDDRPLTCFAGMWTLFNGNRGTKSKPLPGPHHVYGFLTTSANAIVAPIHPKAMTVILQTDEELATWATLATKTAFDAPQIALHSVTSSPSRLSYRDQEHLDGLIKPLQLVDLRAVTQTGSNDRPLPVLGQQRSLVCCHYRQSSSPQPAPALANA
jgi:hypothetical protein